MGITNYLAKKSAKNVVREMSDRCRTSSPAGTLFFDIAMDYFEEFKDGDKNQLMACHLFVDGRVNNFVTLGFVIAAAKHGNPKEDVFIQMKRMHQTGMFEHITNYVNLYELDMKQLYPWSEDQLRFFYDSAFGIYR